MNNVTHSTLTSPTTPPAAPPEERSPLSDILEKVRAFLQENFLYLRPDDFHLADDDRLLERGVIDSMGVAEVIAFLEEEFHLTILEDEISEANLGTLRSIAAFVALKQSTRDAR
jgi:acyl carrier protein